MGCYVQPFCCPLVHSQPAVAGGQRAGSLRPRLGPGELEGSGEQLLGRSRSKALKALRSMVPQQRMHLC